MTFADLGLSDELLRAVDDSGYPEPTPIQRAAIPSVLMNPAEIMIAIQALNERAGIAVSKRRTGPATLDDTTICTLMKVLNAVPSAPMGKLVGSLWRTGGCVDVRGDPEVNVKSTEEDGRQQAGCNQYLSDEQQSRRSRPHSGDTDGDR